MSTFWIGDGSSVGISRQPADGPGTVWRQTQVMSLGRGGILRSNWFNGVSYSAGTVILVSSTVYECILSHYSVTGVNQPGTGGGALFWRSAADWVSANSFMWSYIPAGKTIRIDKARGFWEVAYSVAGAWTATLYANGSPTSVVFSPDGSLPLHGYQWLETTGSYSFTTPTEFYWVVEGSPTTGNGERIGNVQFQCSIAGYQNKLAIYRGEDIAGNISGASGSYHVSMIGDHLNYDHVVRTPFKVKNLQVYMGPYGTPTHPPDYDGTITIQNTSVNTALSISYDASIPFQRLSQDADISFAEFEALNLFVEWANLTANGHFLNSLLTVEYPDDGSIDIVVGNIGYIDIINDGYGDYARITPYASGGTEWTDMYSLTFYPVDPPNLERFSAAQDMTFNTFTLYYADLNPYGSGFNLDVTLYINEVATARTIHLDPATDPTNGVKSSTGSPITVNAGDFIYFKITSPDADDSNFASASFDWFVLETVDPSGETPPSTARYILAFVS